MFRNDIQSYPSFAVSHSKNAFKVSSQLTQSFKSAFFNFDSSYVNKSQMLSLHRSKDSWIRSPRLSNSFVLSISSSVLILSTISCFNFLYSSLALLNGGNESLISEITSLRNMNYGMLFLSLLLLRSITCK